MKNARRYNYGNEILSLRDLRADHRDRQKEGLPRYELDYLNYFTHASFGTDREFEDYIGALRQHSLVRTSIGVEPSDALLTLTTCVGEDYRLVLVGRRIRKGESAALLGTLIE